MDKVKLFSLLALAAFLALCCAYNQIGFMQEKQGQQTVDKTLGLAQTEAEGIKTLAEANKQQAQTIEKMADNLIDTNQDLRKEVKTSTTTQQLQAYALLVLAVALIVLVLILNARGNKRADEKESTR